MQLVHPNATMSRIEKDMSSKIADDNMDILEEGQHYHFWNSIAELKEENKILRNNTSRIADEPKAQGNAITKVTRPSWLWA